MISDRSNSRIPTLHGIARFARRRERGHETIRDEWDRVSDDPDFAVLGYEAEDLDVMEDVEDGVDAWLSNCESLEEWLTVKKHAVVDLERKV